MVPGWGTAASVAIDAGLIAKDVNEANTSQDELDKKLDKKRNLIKVKTKSGEGLMPSLVKFESAVENFKSFSVKGSFSQDISPGTETDSLGKKDPNMHSGDYPGFDTMERVAPFTTGEVSTYPGAQFGASRSGGRTHVGQDISGQKAGDPVLSVMKGTVTEVGSGFTFQNGKGKSQTIGIDHPDGTHSRYVHIVSGVSVGDEVLTGQKIGTVSPADNASSPDFPHLHFELYAKGGGVIDPRPFLNSAPKGTPGVAPISANGDTELKPEKDGADDRESAPPTMDPTVDPGNDGYDMTKTKSGLLRSEIADKKTGFTRGDEEDIKVRSDRMKAMTKALGRDRFSQVLDTLSGGASVENYSAMMKSAGMTDQLKDILKQYRPGMLIDSGKPFKGPGGNPNGSGQGQAQQAPPAPKLPKIEEYPSYNKEGGGTTFVIMSDNSSPQTQAPSPPMPTSRNSKPEVSFIPIGGESLNRTMDELLLTKLSKS
jgi:murein DD-endopeptidase MepM/ murein hydrolase activator NlpD